MRKFFKFIRIYLIVAGLVIFIVNIVEAFASGRSPEGDWIKFLLFFCAVEITYLLHEINFKLGISGTGKDGVDPKNTEAETEHIVGEIMRQRNK